ncbi:transmembrane protein, putative [Medicago truncatula]|uniref:Transmembrane protein, putative n=1 Tax=Medicago truncatula TaxID=3880 RepID=G7LA59_MEDTR|nr:transmembrane protein, putative [Medicago truncatula]
MSDVIADMDVYQLTSPITKSVSPFSENFLIVVIVIVIGVILTIDCCCLSVGEWMKKRGRKRARERERERRQIWSNRKDKS